MSLHGVKQTAAAEGQIAVVGGAGPIGLLVSAVLKAKGLTTIVSEVSQARRAKALESGAADVVIDPTTENLGEVVSEQTSGAMADLAFDAAGAPAVVGQLLDVLGATGRLQVLAIHGAPVEVDITDQLMMQDRTLGASVGYAHDHAEAIDLVRSGKIDLAPFVTSKILAEDIISDGFDRLTNSQDEVKILVSMS